MILINIEFIITTNLGEECFFLPITIGKSIELQIHDALANICFCDAYEIKEYYPVFDSYLIERAELISEYESNYGLIEDDFSQGPYCSNQTIANSIEWEKQRRHSK